MILSVALAFAGVAGFFSRRAARGFLRGSSITLIDAAMAFAFTFAECIANQEAGVFP